MNTYTIAGLDCTGKTSLRGVLEGQGMILGRIIDADYIAKEHNYNNISAGRQVIKIINDCLEKNILYSRNDSFRSYDAKYNKKGSSKRLLCQNVLCGVKH